MNRSLLLYNLPGSISKHWQLMTDDVEGNALHLPEELGGHIGGILISIMIGIIILCIIWWSLHSKSSFKRITSNLGWITFCVSLAGIILYTFGYWEGGLAGNFTALIIHSAVSSFGMFFAQSDLDNIAQVCKDSYVYMTFFSIIHFFAILVSVAFITRLVGFRLVSLWKLRYRKREDLFIFWGINDKSILLAKDIKKTKKRQEKTYHLVFVKTPKEEEITDKTEFSFYNLFNRASQDKNVINDMENLDALVVYSSNIDTLDNFEDTDQKSIFERLGLKSLYKAMRRAKEIHLFFFSENEMANLTTMSILKEAMASKEKDAFGKKEVHLYCHARKSKRTLVYTKPSFTPLPIREMINHVKVHIIDSSDLAINTLKRNPDYHPVNYVKPNHHVGKVEKPFNSLIIGFGETGRDAFKFLYEFGSFVGLDGQKSPFHCTIYDSNMANMRSGFYMRMPAIEKQKDNIVLRDESDSSPFFWKNMKEIIQNLDYVVIAINNDNAGMAIAVNLWEYAVNHRKNNPNKLSIFIRNYHSEYLRYMNDIADYYNNNPTKDVDLNLIIFGSPAEIFTYNIIINNDAELKAMEYYYKYSCAQDGIRLGFSTPKRLWDKRKEQKGYGLTNHRELYHKEMEDFSNVWHIETKMRLMGIYSENDSDLLKTLRKYAESRDKNSNEYPDSNKELQTLFQNLAKCEHLRWCSSSELLGYQPLPISVHDNNKKDYASKLHACLVNCDTLRIIPDLHNTIKYDCTVTDVSLNIKAEEWNL